MSILHNKTLRVAALALALSGIAGGAIIASATPAQADNDRRWRDHRGHDRDDRRWRNNHWDRSDWRRHHPNYYVAPGRVYAPPPVVYAPPPVYPGLSFHFGF